MAVYQVSSLNANDAADAGALVRLSGDRLDPAIHCGVDALEKGLNARLMGRGL